MNATLEWHQDSPSLTQCVSVPIINDECVEEKQEQFIVVLSSEEECVIVETSNQTIVTILDNDSEDYTTNDYDVTACIYIVCAIALFETYDYGDLNSQ